MVFLLISLAHYPPNKVVNPLTFSSLITKASMSNRSPTLRRLLMHISPINVVLITALLCGYSSLTYSSEHLTPEHQPDTPFNAAHTNIDVYKSPSCGCCNGWLEHLDAHGFQTNAINTHDMSQIKDKFGIDARLRSCHTGSANGYVFEGHVPVSVIREFIAKPPEGAIGLSVPGMPIGSPGMEDGDHFQPYKVWLLTAEGNLTEYASIERYDMQF